MSSPLAAPGVFAGISLTRLSALLMATLLIVMAAVLGTAVPANAHDELVGSTPESGASVEELPETVELTFSSVPSGIGAEVEILDPSGENWAEGDVSIVDRVASQPVRQGAPAGEYTVNWRVVSSDSHPIEGTFTVSATNGGSGQSAGPSMSTQGPIEIEESEPASQANFPWSIVVMVVVLIIIASVLVITARKRLRQGADS